MFRSGKDGPGGGDMLWAVETGSAPDDQAGLRIPLLIVTES